MIPQFIRDMASNSRHDRKTALIGIRASINTVRVCAYLGKEMSINRDDEYKEMHDLIVKSAGCDQQKRLAVHMKKFDDKLDRLRAEKALRDRGLELAENA